mgnify:CR=1 FL=1
MSEKNNKPIIFLAFANEQGGEGHQGYLRKLPEEVRRLEEILERAAEIRRTWTGRERKNRGGGGVFDGRTARDDDRRRDRGDQRRGACHGRIKRLCHDDDIPVDRPECRARQHGVG